MTDQEIVTAESAENAERKIYLFFLSYVFQRAFVDFQLTDCYALITWFLNNLR